MKSNVLRPYVNFPSFAVAKRIFKKHDFKITSLHADITKENWIRIYVRWRAKKEEYKFKYIKLGGTLHAGYYKEMELDFPIEYKWKRTNDYKSNLSISIGLQDTNENDLDYSPRFFENLKYGVLVWFSPKNWNDGKKDKEIFKWDRKR